MTAAEIPVVTKTDETLNDAPMIRVDGFFFVDDNDLEVVDEGRGDRWLSERKVFFIHENRIYTRLDWTDAFQGYFPRNTMPAVPQAPGA